LSRIPVVVNPIAGGGRLVRRRPELDAAARYLGIELEWLATGGPGHAAELARRAAESGVPMVLAYGGDGTYNEVAQGLVGTDTALGVLPGGTTSVLAYELGIPRPASRALRPLVEGCDRPMRPGRTDRDDLFLLMLSAGPDAVVLTEVGSRLKRLGGRVGVAAAAARELMRARPLPRFACRVDGATVDAGWVIIGRSRCYAGPFRAVPAADPFGTALQVVVQRRTGRWSAVGFAAAMVVGAHVRRSDVVCRQAVAIELDPMHTSDRVPYQIDGDQVGSLPVRITVEDRVLKLRVPDAA
jgi:diacylglycerol kinase family enzyme